MFLFLKVVLHFLVAGEATLNDMGKYIIWIHNNWWCNHNKTKITKQTYLMWHTQCQVTPNHSSDCLAGSFAKVKFCLSVNILGPVSIYKEHPSRYGYFHYRDKMVPQPSFYNGNPHTGKTMSWHWNSLLNDTGLWFSDIFMCLSFLEKYFFVHLLLENNLLWKMKGI